MADQTNLTDFTNRDDPPTSGEKPDSNPERYKDEEWLHEQYWELGRSMADIAEEVSVTATTIGRWMKKHGIERRSQKEIQSDDNIEQLKDEDWLLKQYHELEKSLQDIADSLGTTPPTVNQYMENHGIERRAISESRAATDLSRLRSDPEWLAEQYHGRDRTMGEIADELGTYASTVKQWLHNHGIETDSEAEAKSDGDISRLADEEWLYSQYWEHGLTTYEIADEVGTSVQPVLRLMNKYGIERRSSSAAQTDADLEKLENEEWLHRQYCQKERTLKDIGEEIGGTQSVVISYMDRYGIERRSAAESQTDADLDRLNNPEWLQKQYHERNLTLDSIAAKVGSCQRTVVNYMNKHGIDRRSRIQDPDHLDHIVRSNWELEIATLFAKWGIEYEYESLAFNYGDGRRYEPDFVTTNYVIEVKGHLFDDRDERKKAQVALDRLEDMEYVVVGVELPADVHLPWEDRHELRDLIASE